MTDMAKLALLDQLDQEVRATGCAGCPAQLGDAHEQGCDHALCATSGDQRMFCDEHENEEECGVSLVKLPSEEIPRWQLS